MKTASLIELRNLRRHFRGLAWRGVILVVVFACGFLALHMGVELSERRHGDYDTLTQLYYTLGLFVLGGLDLGVPTGGSEFARILLWFAYFAAPTITAASVIEGVLHAVAPERWRLRRLRKHVVIVGCGRAGRLYLKKLRQKQPRKFAVMVELHPDHPSKAEVSDVHGAIFLPGDIRDDGLLGSLRLEWADRVMLLTGDDYINLDTAAKIMARVPKLAERTVVRVSSLRLARILGKTPVAKECAIFNEHQAAASKLVQTELLAHFHATKGRDTVVLAGFGRFGQTVLDQLQRQAVDRFDHVIIIDSSAERTAATFDHQVGFASFYSREIIEGDLRDSRVWRSVANFDMARLTFIIGSGDDGANLSTALWVKAEFPRAYVVARNFYSSPFADEVSREGGFLTFSLADLVTASMPDAWFGAR